MGARTGTSGFLPAPRVGLRPPRARMTELPVTAARALGKSAREGSSPRTKEEQKQRERVAFSTFQSRGRRRRCCRVHKDMAVHAPSLSAPLWRADGPGTGVAESKSHTALCNLVTCWKTLSRGARLMHANEKLINPPAQRVITVSDLCQTNKRTITFLDSFNLYFSS